jgi:hypothetical protein
VTYSFYFILFCSKTSKASLKRDNLFFLLEKKKGYYENQKSKSKKAKANQGCFYREAIVKQNFCYKNNGVVIQKKEKQ